MNEEKTMQAKEQTLMQVFEKLDTRCNQLKEVAGMTERLNYKLNRTEDEPKPIDGCVKKEMSVTLNIVELFDLIAQTMEQQINVIGNNTERSMNMID